MLMCMRTKDSAVPPGSSGGGGEREWEVRPGGMLVQKRSNAEQDSPSLPSIRIRVKYGSNVHQVHISSQATFGELKRILAGKTGLHHEDQKMIYKNKERDSKAFLDHSGVKDKSKVVLVEDPMSLEKRYIEMKKNANLEKAAKTISEISFEVDRLAREVAAVESVISKGKQIVEKDVTILIELLMNKLVKLDGINIGNDNVESQRKMQVKRVQKYVETLDILKVKTSMPTASGNQTSPSQHSRQNGHSSLRQSDQGRNPFSIDLCTQSRYSSSGEVVITTQWETFESALAPSFPTPTTCATVVDTNNNSTQSWCNLDLLL